MNGHLRNICLLLASGLALNAAKLTISVHQTELSAPTPKNPLTPRLLTGAFQFGAIAAVNDKPAGGMWTSSISDGDVTTSGQSGTRLITWSFAITSTTGARIGEITASLVISDTQFHDGGLIEVAALPIVSAGGAYFGAQGLVRAPENITAGPLLRPRSGNTGAQFEIDLTPLSLPSYVTMDQSPAILHAGDGSLVTSNNPAQNGEKLTAYVTALLPEIESSPDSWPASAQDLGRLPVDFLIGGVAAEVLYIGTVAGTPGRYQVNMRVPASVRPGTVELQILSGFMAGPKATLPIL